MTDLKHIPFMPLLNINRLVVTAPNTLTYAGGFSAGGSIACVVNTNGRLNIGFNVTITTTRSDPAEHAYWYVDPLVADNSTFKPELIKQVAYQPANLTEKDGTRRTMPMIFIGHVKGKDVYASAKCVMQSLQQYKQKRFEVPRTATEIKYNIPNIDTAKPLLKQQFKAKVVYFYGVNQQQQVAFWSVRTADNKPIPGEHVMHYAKYQPASQKGTPVHDAFTFKTPYGTFNALKSVPAQ